MKLLSRLFKSLAPAAAKLSSSTSTGSQVATAAGEWMLTTAENPFRIDDPVIGFLNARGSEGEATMQADRQILSPLFRDVRVSRLEIPHCSILFLYIDLDPTGRIHGRGDGLRDIIKSAGAYVAVVASEHPLSYYRKCLGPRNDWSANITLTVDRKGNTLAEFFAEVFRRMYAGESMLMAWVKLAPQFPGSDHPDLPGTIMAAEAGHLVLGGTGGHAAARECGRVHW